jgi:hypothetical protein
VAREQEIREASRAGVADATDFDVWGSVWCQPLPTGRMRAPGGHDPARWLVGCSSFVSRTLD